MTDSEYLALTSACDALLSTKPLTPEKLAVSWLHVLSEHPNNLSRYKDVFKQSTISSRHQTRLWNLLGILELLIRSLWAPKFDVPVDTEFPDRLDVIFMSHLVSLHANSQSADFYYGRLPEELATRGLSSLVALQNHVSSHDKILKARLTRGGMTSRIVLPRRFAWGEEFRMYHRARAVALTFRQLASATQSIFEKTVAIEAARQAASRSTMASLRIHNAVMRLCARFKPRALIVTWEGHAWERLAFHAARTVNPSIRCIGYQHAILFPRTHALKRPLGKSYDPDVLLTVGEVNRNILKASLGLRNIPIVIYGSHRRVSTVEPCPVSGSLSQCIVLPEGLASECLALFRFALNAARTSPNVQYVLRTHPVLPFDWLARRHSWLRTLPANVRVSNQNDISADFSGCAWAIYRGSSAAVHAVLAGLRPVYVALPDELPIDPLFALKGWRRHVTTVEEFRALVAADQIMTPEARRREWEPAKAFCDQYVVAPDPNIVAEIIAD